MNRGLWIARKNYLITLIRKVSDIHGGDSPEFFNQYCKEVIDVHDNEKIEEAIECFQEMVARLK